MTDSAESLEPPAQLEGSSPTEGLLCQRLFRVLGPGGVGVGVLLNLATEFLYLISFLASWAWDSASRWERSHSGEWLYRRKGFKKPPPGPLQL